MGNRYWIALLGGGHCATYDLHVTKKGADKPLPESCRPIELVYRACMCMGLLCQHYYYDEPGAVAEAVVAEG